MNYNTDGFNERSVYIHNSVDKSKTSNINFDNSFAKMRSEERKNIVETVNNDKNEYVENAKGNIDNFVLRNNNMRNANRIPSQNNPVFNAMNRNMFKK